MAEIKTVIQDNIHSFLKKLHQVGYQISSAYIFGSYISGQMDEWSDIDDKPLPFSLDSFTDDNPLVRQIKTNWVLIEAQV